MFKQLINRLQIEYWSVRAGATFIFAEYTTSNKLYLENDRFRNKALMGMFGVSYSPFRN